MKLTKEELLRNLKNVQEKYKDKIYKTFELNIYAMVSDVIDYLENEHFESSECRVESSLTRSNPPLNFEELKEGMWVWDNLKKEYIQIEWLNISGESSKYLIAHTVPSNEYQRLYSNNRFYRKEVKYENS